MWHFDFKNSNNHPMFKLSRISKVCIFYLYLLTLSPGHQRHRLTSGINNSHLRRCQNTNDAPLIHYRRRATTQFSFKRAGQNPSVFICSSCQVNMQRSSTRCNDGKKKRRNISPEWFHTSALYCWLHSRTWGITTLLIFHVDESIESFCFFPCCTCPSAGSI